MKFFDKNVGILYYFMAKFQVLRNSISRKGKDSLLFVFNIIRPYNDVMVPKDRFRS